MFTERICGSNLLRDGVMRYPSGWTLVWIAVSYCHYTIVEAQPAHEVHEVIAVSTLERLACVQSLVHGVIWYSTRYSTISSYVHLRVTNMYSYNCESQI
jgi:hypothetical protein